jgi:RNase P subunit RPR2
MREIVRRGWTETQRFFILVSTWAYPDEPIFGSHRRIPERYPSEVTGECKECGAVPRFREIVGQRMLVTCRECGRKEQVRFRDLHKPTHTAPASSSPIGSS